MKGSLGWVGNLQVQVVVVVAICLVSSCCSEKLGETCGSKNQCGSGLICQTCAANGNTRPRCTQIRPTNPTSKVKGLAFNRYSWVTTHNSYARYNSSSATGSILISPTNQEDNVTTQLNNGVRGLMLDMYDFQNDIWLCHSFGGQCYGFTAFQPALNVLREIESFLASNPSEIVTIFIEDYVKSSNGLTKLFNASGLSKYWFPLSRMPTNGAEWPTVDDMVAKNQRLVVFTSNPSKQSSEGIAYQWNYLVENEYGDEGMNKTCTNRAESSAMDTKSKALVLMNYFPNDPRINVSCANNSAPLISMMNTCHNASGNRWPNFIAVDFYQRSDWGGVSEAVDEANGHATCGCDNIAYCRANSTFGTCDVPPMSPPPPAAAATTGGGGNQSSHSQFIVPPKLLQSVPLIFALTSLFF